MDAVDGQTQLSIPLTPDQLADHFESAIISGRWAPGTKLPSERKLSLQYHLSRPTVRESLRRIQERGLIIAQPGRGSFVREHRPTGGLVSVALGTRRNQVTARQLARARQMLESETAALAAEHRTELDITHMRSVLERFDSATDTGSSIGFDLAFHEAIAVASCNVVLQLMFGSIRALTQGLMLRSLTDRTVRGLAAPLHRTILEAIERQDADAARQVMREHLHIAEDHYGADIDEPMDDMIRRWASHLPEMLDAPYDPPDDVGDPAATATPNTSPR